MSAHCSKSQIGAAFPDLAQCQNALLNVQRHVVFLHPLAKTTDSITVDLRLSLGLNPGMTSPVHKSLLMCEKQVSVGKLAVRYGSELNGAGFGKSPLGVSSVTALIA